MSTHNICFCREIRKILCGYLLLSGAMVPILRVNIWYISSRKTFRMVVIEVTFNPYPAAKCF